MANLRLHSNESRVTELPDLCMQCGEPAILLKRKQFSWFPPWVWVLLFVCGLLPFAIVAFITTKKRSIEAPLCEAHKNHWLYRQLLVLGSLFGVILVGAVSWVFMLDNDNDFGRGRNNDLGGFLCAGSVLLLILWVIFAVVVQFNSIRAKEITDRDMTLAGVAQEFVRAYEAEWRVDPIQLDDLARQRWNDRRSSPLENRRESDEDERIRLEDDDRPSPSDGFREDSN